jgi:peroxiredoxin
MKLSKSVASAVSGLAVLAAATACGRAGESAGRLEIGATAPMTAVKMKNIDGRELSIADVAGEKGTLVIFSCNHCPYVVAWEPRIAEIGNAYQKKGIGVIVINPNDPKKVPQDGFEAMQKRAQERGFEFPYVVDATSDVARAYGATKTPEVFLFDKDWKLVYHGAIDDNSGNPSKVEAHYLRDALEALISDEEIALPQTKAIGCTIKFRPKT